ncbi:hypothetical protein V5799_033480 [Amblyomma americanum]|uniref:LisH domain-containing protein n=1 Tax=Amblyomma americanum TaxID=6943 RepID=A0AAQ4DN72_AMBAM
MSQSTAPLSKSRSSDKTSTEEPSRAEWLERLDKVHLHRGDLNRLIMDYLVTEGFKEAADKFRLEAGVVPPVPLDTLDERIRIRDCLQDASITLCLHDALQADMSAFWFKAGQKP